MEFVLKVVFIIMCYHLVMNIIKFTMIKLYTQLENQLKETSNFYDLDGK